MSRIGNKPIQASTSVNFDIQPTQITVTGPKGALTVEVPKGISVSVDSNIVTITRDNDTRQLKAYHGLVRSLIANAITGVDKGYDKKLELHGVGYRAAMDGEGLNLSLGYSHPVKIPAVPGISFKVEKNTITISGIDKQLVGQVAADIRENRKPEPYKGKGIRYSDEHVRRKPGKTAKGATA